MKSELDTYTIALSLYEKGFAEWALPQHFHFLVWFEIIGLLLTDV